MLSHQSGKLPLLIFSSIFCFFPPTFYLLLLLPVAVADCENHLHVKLAADPLPPPGAEPGSPESPSSCSPAALSSHPRAAALSALILPTAGAAGGAGGGSFTSSVSAGTFPTATLHIHRGQASRLRSHNESQTKTCVFITLRPDGDSISSRTAQ